MDKQTTTSGGISFFGLLTIVFIVLKLTGFISWSWFWVLSPVLLPLIIGIGLIIIYFILLFIFTR